MSFFNVSVVGTNTIQRDLETELKNIENQSNLALNNIGAEMVNTLQKFINEVWYKGYKPKVYKRRTDGAGGTPIGSRENMDYKVSKRQLYFSYEPTGEHINPKWSNRNGDKLIEHIQQGLNDYTEKEIPPRPFWNDFIEEEQFELFSTFKNAMLPYSVIADGQEIYDLSEFDLEE